MLTASSVMVKGISKSKCRSGKNNSSATKRQQNLIKEDTPTNASSKSCETSLDAYTSFLFHTKDSAFSSDPYIIKTHLDKVKFGMELDTGAARSVLSSVDFYKLWPAKVDRPTIDNSSSTLKAYGGFKLPVLGEIKVLVKTDSHPTGLKNRPLHRLWSSKVMVLDCSVGI